jgi:hypothetical protein
VKPADPTKPTKTSKTERASTVLKKAAMLAALAQTRGVVTAALSLLATRPAAEGGPVEIGARTYYDWLKTDSEFAESISGVGGLGDQRIDFAETQLNKLMSGYTVPDERVVMTTVITTTTSLDAAGKTIKTVTRTTKPEVVKMSKVIPAEPRSVEFFLETQGKKRGYDKKINVKVAGLGKLKVIKTTTKPHANPAESTLKVTKAARSQQ